MKKKKGKSCGRKWFVGLGLAAVALLAVGVFQAAGLSKTYTIDWGPGGDTFREGMMKSEQQNAEFVTWFNNVINNNAGTTTPTNPEEGQFWFDTGNYAMKQYHLGTWASVWSYANTTDFIFPSTIRSATINTLTTNYWDQDSFQLNTLTVAMAGSIEDFWVGDDAIVGDKLDVGGKATFASTVDFDLQPEGCLVSVSAADSREPDGERKLTFGSETYDVGNWHASGSSVVVVPADVDYVIACGNFQGQFTTNPGEDLGLFVRIEKNGAASVGWPEWYMERVTGYADTNDSFYIPLGCSPPVSVAENDEISMMVQLTGTTTNTRLKWVSGPWLAVRKYP